MRLTSLSSAGLPSHLRRSNRVVRRSQRTLLSLVSVDDHDTATTKENGASLSKIELLDSLHLPYGLRQELLQAASQDKVFKRFWIVDNSGSMAVQDGHTLKSSNKPLSTTTTTITPPGSIVHMDCTSSQESTTEEESARSRWAEVEETVQTHAQLMATLGAPTEFRLLNPPVDTPPTENTAKGWLRLPKFPVTASSAPAQASGCPQSFRVGYSSKAPLQAKESQRARTILARSEPKGSTPLVDAIRQVKSEIQDHVLPQLSEGQSVVLVLATDGSTVSKETLGTPQGDPAQESSLVVEALRELEGLPVSVILRLCTDYATVVDQYNRLDSTDNCHHTKQSLDEDCSISLRVDVLDDYLAEAKEVYEHNPWLNYALIVHRMREMGPVDPLLDLLDERPLTRSETKELIERFLLGSSDDNAEFMGDIYVSDKEWAAFVLDVHHLQAHERLQKHPLTQRLEPWFDVSRLAQIQDASVEEDHLGPILFGRV